MTTVSIEERTYSLEVAGEALTVSVAADAVRVLELGVPGPQGPPGDAQGTTLVAGEALSALRVVRADPATGRAFYADAGTAAHAGLAVGLTLTSGALGAPVTVLTAGLAQDANWAWDVSPGADRRLYLGANGLLGQGPPGGGAAFVQRVGVVASATSAVVRVGESVLG